MAMKCNILVPEDFVINIVRDHKIRDRYQEFCFRDYVKVKLSLLFIIQLNNSWETKQCCVLYFQESVGISRSL